MVESISYGKNIEDIKDKEQLENEINSFLEDDNLIELFELTYSYKTLDNGLYYNTSIFDRIAGGIELKSYEDDYKNVYNALIDIKIKLENFKLHLNNFSEDSKLIILKGSIDYYILLTEASIEGIPFELEKAGLQHNLNEQDIQTKLKKIEDIEANLFGGNVRENSFEINESYKLLIDIFNNKKDILSEKEKEDFYYFLENIKYLDDFSGEYNNTNYIKSDSLEQKNFFSKVIDREKVVEIFKIIFDLYDINKKVEITDVDSVFDSKEGLKIPNTESNKKFKLYRVLGLIAHEIETHYLIQENNEKVLGGIEGNKKLEREEGLAKFMELKLKNEYIEGTGYNTTQILIGETHNGKEFKRFLELFNKLTSVDDLNEKFKRRKRNYSFFYKGVQHKDVTYNRGLQKVNKFLIDGGDFRDLFIAKVGFQDVKLVKSNLDKEIQLKLPLFIGELILFYIETSELDLDKFMSYIQKKYSFIKAYFNQDYKSKLQSKEKYINKVLEIINNNLE